MPHQVGHQRTRLHQRSAKKRECRIAPQSPHAAAAAQYFKALERLRKKYAMLKNREVHWSHPNSNAFWLLFTTAVVMLVTLFFVDWGDQRTIAVIITALPGTKCLGAVETALNEALYSNRLYFYIVNVAGRDGKDKSCLKGYTGIFMGSAVIREHIGFISETFSPHTGMNAAKAQLIEEHITSKRRAFDFVLEAHSHTLFGSHWDDRILSEWTSIGDQRSLLTTHPSDSDQMSRRGSYPGMNILCKTILKNPYRGQDLPIIAYDRPMQIKPPGQVIDDRGRRQFVPIEVPFWSSYLSFGPFEYLLEVPYDPNLKNIIEEDGPELLYAARLRTHGFKFYAPTQDLVWHSYQIHHFEKDHMVRRDYSQLDKDQKRIWGLLTEGKEYKDDPYGFGNDMSVKKYLNMVEVDLEAEDVGDKTDLCLEVKGQLWKS